MNPMEQIHGRQQRHLLFFCPWGDKWRFSLRQPVWLVPSTIVQWDSRHFCCIYLQHQSYFDATNEKSCRRTHGWGILKTFMIIYVAQYITQLPCVEQRVLLCNSIFYTKRKVQHLTGRTAQSLRQCCRTCSQSRQIPHNCGTLNSWSNLPALSLRQINAPKAGLNEHVVHLATQQ